MSIMCWKVIKHYVQPLRDLDRQFHVSFISIGKYIPECWDVEQYYCKK